MRLWVILTASQLTAANLCAQATARVDTIAEARRLRDANDFAGAAMLMRSYIASHPDDSGSARFAALMSYWSKDQTTANSVYAQAISNHPGDADLRLEYGRFLVETGNTNRARVILRPFVAADSVSFSHQHVARARALLGTADYWRGDFTGARNEFRAALALDSSLVGARRQLPEIETACVVGVPDPLYGEEVVAFVELRPGRDFDARAIGAFCREHLARFKTPKLIFQLHDWPRGPNGKVQRRRLLDLYRRFTSSNERSST